MKCIVPLRANQKFQRGLRTRIVVLKWFYFREVYWKLRQNVANVFLTTWDLQILLKARGQLNSVWRKEILFYILL